ncbi:MAG: IS1380 family transposase [Blastocatellia bacterium]
MVVPNVIGKAGKFNICFQETTLSNHAGAVLIKEFTDRLGLELLINSQLEVKERERGYTESESILALCWNLILGGDCLDDLNVLRGDVGTQELLGLESVIAPTTAGEFLRKFSIGDLTALRTLLGKVAERMRPLQMSEVVTLDFDGAIYEQCSKRKQGSRKAYNGKVGYAPLFCFWAEEAELLLSHLLSGNRNPASKIVWFFYQALKWVPAGRRLKVRADSAFYKWDFILALEREGATYAITADQTKQMRQQLEAIPQKNWKSYGHGTKAEVAEFWYAPDRQAPHRYIAKRERRKTKKGEEYWHYHVIITNDLRSTARQVCRWALKRCAMENLIKEHKTGFGLEKMPTNNYHANWAWLLIGQLAFNIVAWFKRQALPEQYHTATIKTIRHHLLNVAGKIVSSGKQFFLMLSDESLFQDVWAFALRRLADFKSG